MPQTGTARGLPLIGVRVGEGRSGTTLMLQLLATAPEIVFDRGYPAEYRFFSYLARMGEAMTEPFDDQQHPGVTEFFFGPDQRLSPIPFRSVVVDVASLTAPLLHALWAAWSGSVRDAHPGVRYYAEKLAVPVDTAVRAGIDLRLIDIIRDPRDMLASIRAFTARGIEGFGRVAGQSEADHLDQYIETLRAQYELMASTPSTIDRVLIRYEDCAASLQDVARTLRSWLGVRLDATVVLAQRPSYAHHTTTSTAQDSIGRWQHDLSTTEASHIEHALGPLLAELGYPLPPASHP